LFFRSQTASSEKKENGTPGCRRSIIVLDPVSTRSMSKGGRREPSRVVGSVKIKEDMPPITVIRSRRGAHMLQKTGILIWGGKNREKLS